jgi:nitrate/nitrite transporter NarK
LWWSWFGKSQDSLNYSGAHLHSFWVSNTRNLYICILVFFFCVCVWLSLPARHPEIASWFHFTDSQPRATSFPPMAL